jgi:hypothetical protein
MKAKPVWHGRSEAKANRRTEDRGQKSEDGGQKTEDEEATSSTGARASCPLCHASCRATINPVGRCGLAAPIHLEEVFTAKAAFLRKET